MKAQVVPDLAARLERWKPVDMPFREDKLSARERELVAKLVSASQELENIYWRQSDPEGLALYRELGGSPEPAEQPNGSG